MFSSFVLSVQAQIDVATDSLKTTTDSLVITNDSIGIVDSVKVAPKNESDIKAPINYSAKDSMKFSVKSKMIYAYGEGKLEMEDMKLDAGCIKMDMDSNYIYAEALADEKGELQGKPIFNQGGEEYKTETIRYNTKTKKGLVTHVVTEVQGGYMHSGKTKMHPN